jgi:hypothetical protein
VNAAAINTFRKATDAPITTAKKIMQADRPDLSDEELSTIQGSTIENFVNIINSKYNIGVTVEERALSFDEVKKKLMQVRLLRWMLIILMLRHMRRNKKQDTQ